MSPRRSIRAWLLCAVLATSAAALPTQAPLVDLLSNPSAPLSSPANDFVREHVRVETAPLYERTFDGQPIDVAVRVWLEREFSERSLQQLSARRLDLPVQVLCPWLERHTWVVESDSPTLTVALGERVVTARRLPEREFEQRVWRGFELRARLAPRAPGVMLLDAPQLRLVYATEFRATLIDEREATDSRIAGLEGAVRELAVEALPEAGRPLDFGGAIGRFELSARVDRSEIAVGETFRLEVSIQGDGNLGDFEPPRLAPSSDYRVVGQLARRSGDKLVVTYDLSALSRRLVQTPTVTLSYFEPSQSGGYRTASAQPIALRVLGGTTRAPADSAPQELPGLAAADSLFVLAGAFLALLAGAPVLVWLWLRRRKRRAE